MRRLVFLLSLLSPYLFSLHPADARPLPAAHAPILSTNVTYLPYTGTAIVTWKAMGLLQAPMDALSVIGTHREVIHFSVRNPTHYRITIETTSPALDTGSRTVAVNGNTVTAYDSRTGTAARSSARHSMNANEASHDLYNPYFFCVTDERDGWQIVSYRYPQRGESCYWTEQASIDSLPASVQALVPPEGSVDPNACTVESNAADPREQWHVYFVRCKALDISGRHRIMTAWGGRDDNRGRPAVADGPAPIKDIAAWREPGTAPAWTPAVATATQAPSYLQDFLQHGFTALMSGNDERGDSGIPYFPLPFPNPAQSLSSYLDALKAPTQAGLPPHSVKIVGTARILGRKVVVVDYGPGSTDLSGCSNNCRAQATGSGDARLWIDATHPCILRYKLLDLPDALLSASSFPDMVYRVTEIAFGNGPSNRALQYRPPVPPTVHDPILMPRYASFPLGLPPRPFVAVPAPTTLDSAFWCHGSEWFNEGLSRSYTLGVYYFFKDPTRQCGSPSGQRSYLLVLERIQLHGLPARLQHGTLVRLGSCRGWTNTSRGQRWFTFARGSVTTEVVSNTLTRAELKHYVISHLCGSWNHLLHFAPHRSYTHVNR